MQENGIAKLSWKPLWLTLCANAARYPGMHSQSWQIAVRAMAWGVALDMCKHGAGTPLVIVGSLNDFLSSAAHLTPSARVCSCHSLKYRIDHCACTTSNLSITTTATSP